MKKIFCLTLLSVAAFADPYSWQQDEIQQGLLNIETEIRRQNMETEIRRLQTQAEAQHQMRIATYQKIYENSTKEKQLDECADELYAAKLGEKWNPTPCLDYMNPRK